MTDQQVQWWLAARRHLAEVSHPEPQDLRDPDISQGEFYRSKLRVSMAYRYYRAAVGK